MAVLEPQNAEQVAEMLVSASEKRRTIQISGNGSKRLWGGPITQIDDVLSTAGLDRLLEYEKNDLTVSVEAGMRFWHLQQTLANHGQMVALDPPYAKTATVGGVVAANSSGTMRRRYGTARDLIIGMTFATVSGKVVSSGGRVVKNVAGLDMAKLMIGSFGTLAAIASVNLRIHPMPDEWRTFIFHFDDLPSALLKQQEILRSYLRPVALELFNSRAASKVGFSGITLAIRAAGSPTVLARYDREINDSLCLKDQKDALLWERIQEFAPDQLEAGHSVCVLRVHANAKGVQKVLELATGPAVYRCGTGTVYLFFEDDESLRASLRSLAEIECAAFMEAAPEQLKREFQDSQTHSRGGTESGFATMKRVKALFDPNSVLNPMRLYGRI